jgi:hypothetical protein
MRCPERAGKGERNRQSGGGQSGLYKQYSDVSFDGGRGSLTGELLEQESVSSAGRSIKLR